MKFKNYYEFNQYIISEAKKMMKNPCWNGYEIIGTKKKKGKNVPNCVPKKESIKECDCENDENGYEEVEGQEYIYTLNSIVDRAEELTGLMNQIDELPSWVQDKIAAIDNDIEDVYDYLMDENQEYVEEDDSDYKNWDEDDLMEAHDILEKWGKLEWKEVSNLNESQLFQEAEYQGRKVQLGKIMAGDVKKFKVYVRNDKGNVVKVNFGQKGVKIKKNNPERRKSFRARHKCSSPGPKWKARYWSCKKW